MFNIYKRNIWTHETEHIGTAPDAYTADRRSLSINTEFRRQGDIEHYTYFEPVDGWPAEKARAAAIEKDWQTWRQRNGLTA